MSGSPLSFKNAHPFYYETIPSLMDLASTDTIPENLSDKRLNDDQIMEVILFTAGLNPTDFQKIEKNLEAKKLRVVEIQADSLRDHDHFESLRQANLDILKSLKKGGIILIYERGVQEAVETFLSTTLLTLKDDRLTPERLSRLIAGDHPPLGNMETMSAYRTFLEKPAPAQEKNHRQADKQEQTESTPDQTSAEKAPAPLPDHEQENAITTNSASKSGKGPEQNIDERIPAQEKKEKKKKARPPKKESPLYNPEFKLSRWTIRFKLATIISAIIVSSLSIATLFSLDIFRDHTTTLIQEYNLSLARLIGRKVEDELSEINYRTGMLISFIEEGKNKSESKSRYSRIFFHNNPEYLFVGFLKPLEGVPEFEETLVNETYLNNHEISREDLKKLHKDVGSLYTRASSGEVVIENISPGFARPLVAVAIPIHPSTTDGSSDDVLVAYIDSSTLIQSFRSIRQSRFFQVMIVNEQGYVIAHSDDRETMARSNHSNMPIVQTMLKSPIPNGSRRFDYKNISYLGSFQNLDFGGLGVISMVRTDQAFQAVYRIQVQNIILSLMVLTAAFLIVFIFAKTISSPIVRLVGATREIEEGNYHIDIKPTSHDEIGVLTNSFQHMAKGLEEREKIKDTFGKFVNKEIADRAIQGGITLGGEKRKVTVLFSDLRDFTALSESNDPARVVQMLNGYFTGMVDCIHQTQGVVDKFIGDAIMAHWGALQNTQNDAKSAVDAAIAMRKALIAFNESPENEDLANLRIGVGINTGPVISGQIGSEQKLEYTVIGDTVNLASRIEFMNKHFGTDILISSYTCSDVEGLYELVEMPAMNIKGKSRPEVTYAVLGHRGDPDTPESLDQLRKLLGIDYDDTAARERMEKASADSVAEKEKNKSSGGL